MSGDGIRKALVVSLALIMTLGSLYPTLSINPVSGEKKDLDVLSAPENIKWADPLNITNNDVGDSYPALVVDGNPETHVYIAYYQNRKDFKFQEYQVLGKRVQRETTLMSGSMAFQRATYWAPYAQPSEYFGVDTVGNLHLLRASNSDPWSEGVYQKFSNSGKPISLAITLQTGFNLQHSIALGVGANNMAYFGLENATVSQQGLLMRLDKNFKAESVEVNENTDGISLVVDKWDDDAVHYFSRTSLNGIIFHSKLTFDLQMVISHENFFQGVLPGNGLDSPVPIATTTPNGHIHLMVYNRSANPKTIYYGELDKDGIMVNDGRYLTITEDGCDYGDIVGDKENNVHVVWGACNDGSVHYTKIVEGDETDSLESPSNIVSEGLPGISSWPQIGVDVGGGLHVVFLNDGDGDNEVIYRYSYSYGVSLETVSAISDLMFLCLNETKTGTFTIKNTGNLNDTYLLNISVDMNGHENHGWAAWLDETELELPPQEIGEIQVNVKGPTSGELNENINITIKATSNGAPQKNDEMSLKVFFVFMRGIQLAVPDNVHITCAGEPTEFQINVKNQGDIAEDVLLTLDGPVDWDYELDIYEVLLAPRTSTAMHLTVIPAIDAYAGAIGTVLVEGYSKGNPSLKSRIMTRIVVCPDLLITLETDNITHYVDPGRSTTFFITATSHGNLPDYVMLIFEMASDIGDWIAVFDRTSIGLTANSKGTIGVKMVAPPNAIANSSLLVKIIAHDDHWAQRFEVETKLVVNPVHELLFNLTPTTITTTPGDIRSIDAHVANNGNEFELLKTGITNLPIGWNGNFLYKGAQVTDIDLEPWAHKALNLNLEIPAFAHSGTYLLNTFIDNGRGINLTRTINIIVKHFPIVQIECPNPKMNGIPNSKVSFSLTIKNLGNGPDTLNLRVMSELTNDWGISFETKDGSVDNVLLDIGEEIELNLLINIPVHPYFLMIPMVVNVTTFDGSSTYLDLELSIKLPDLTFVHFQPSLGLPEKGKSYCYDVMVLNDGDFSSGQFILTFSIDGFIAYQMDIGPIDPGQSVNTTFCWIPSATGDYYVKFALDPNYSIMESNEMNNVIEITGKIPKAHKSQIDPQPFLFTIIVVLSTIVIFGKPKRKTRIRIIRLRRAP